MTDSITIEIPDTIAYEFVFNENNPNWMAWNETNYMFLRAIASYAHKQLNARGYLFLNELLVNLGFDPIPIGQIIGWTSDSDNVMLWEILTDQASLSPDIHIRIRPDGVIYDKI